MIKATPIIYLWNIKNIFESTKSFVWKIMYKNIWKKGTLPGLKALSQYKGSTQSIAPHPPQATL